jgi:hypothetical protein
LSDIISAFYGINWLIKFLSIVIFYFFFSFLVKNGKVSFIVTFIKYTILFISINFILGYLGYGYPMYLDNENGIGTKGFIYAGNELSAIVIVSGSILQMFLIEKRKYLLFSFVAILMIIMAVLLTSKVSIFASFLITLFFPLIKNLKKLKSLKLNKKDSYYLLVIFIILPLLILSVINYVLYSSNLIDRLAFFYQKSDLITVIFSHRNIWAKEALDIFYNQYTLFEYLFGRGLEWTSLISNKKMVEIDIIDFLMAYGIFGIFITYCLWLFILLKLYWNRNINNYYGYLVFMFLLLFIISLTGGHILNSGISGATIGALLSLLYIKNKKETRIIN